MLIDTKHWKKFRIYDIFFIDSGSKLDKTKMNTDKPEINFIGRSSINNGITEKVNKINDLEPYKAGNMTLALGGTYLGSCFIQPKDFYTSQNVIVLIPKHNLTFNQKQFIASMIFKEAQMNYCAFKDELNKHIKTDFAFYLPAKQNNEPDWQYMDNYVKNIKSKVKDNFVNLNLIKNSNNYQKIDLSSWKEFNFFDIFDKDYCTGNTKIKIQIDGDIPLISTTKENNGIIKYIKYNSNNKLFPKNRITLAKNGNVGCMFYQNKEFCATNDILVLKVVNKDVSKECILFLINVFQKYFKFQYSWNDKISINNVLPKCFIKLPVNKENELDWQYMENYIKKLSNDIHNN